MAFSSYIGYPRRSGGGWPRALLPSSSSNPKSASSSSKLPRKSRKRALFKDFIAANFFTLGLAFSLLFFLFVVFRYGIPKPISTRFKSRPFRTRSHHYRNRTSKAFASNDTSALVDVTTKDLYDQIDFSDVDGGAWKQGWPVTYKGNEWDSEKLKIFVVPHSHNDPGWKRTVDEYYEQQSRHILNTIVDTLSKDVRRKFIWEEMSYLEKWWRDAPDAKKEVFISLVQNGQLEIVGGGWVMNDEANSHYFAIIEQITEGNMWLNDTIGVVPKNSWAIDPFGYSPTMAYLLRRMGFENMLIQRTHYELKKELAKKKKLEYVWRQSWDFDETTDIFVHMMPFYSYDIPHTCGPEPAICCQFDFARMRGFMYELCPWHVDPVETTQDNVQERALLLLDQYRKKSTLYRTNTLLVPLGDDFRYISIDEAEAQFRNYQLIFDHINSNPSLNAEAMFGTLDDYFRTLREEADRVNYSFQNHASAFNGLNALSGVGIMSIPYALACGGWLSLICFFVVAVSTFYTGLLIRKCMDIDPNIRSYPDIGERAFGPIGRMLVVVVMCFELYLVATGFLILEGDNLHNLFPNMELQILHFVISGRQCFVIIVALIILPTVWLDNLGVLSYISASGVLASAIILCSITWTGLFEGVGFHQKGTLINWSGIPTALSLYTFCYCSHPVFPTLYTSMKKKHQFSNVLLLCFLLCTFCYASMAVFGYMMFGPNVQSQITLDLPVNKLSSKVAIYTALVNPVSKYALMVTPIIGVLENLFPSYQKSQSFNLLIQTALVVSTVVVALAVPFFGSLMSLVGALLSVTASVLLPCLCYLKISGSYRRFGCELVMISGVIVLGVMVAIFGTYTSLLEIIRQW